MKLGSFCLVWSPLVMGGLEVEERLSDRLLEIIGLGALVLLDLAAIGKHGCLQEGCGAAALGKAASMARQDFTLWIFS